MCVPIKCMIFISTSVICIIPCEIKYISKINIYISVFIIIFCIVSILQYSIKKFFSIYLKIYRWYIVIT